MAPTIHPMFLREIPDFIIDSIVFCDCLTFKRDEKSIFILAKNLKFYEFRKKQLQYSLNLKNTYLSSIQKQIELYRNDIVAPNCKGDSDASHCHSAMDGSAPIKFGKYIYRNFEISKIYLLLHCWDKLIVMEHCNTNGLKLTTEYEKVTNFKIVHHSLMKYQAEVEIHFDDGIACIDFQENCSNTMDVDKSDSDKVTQKSEFKYLLERVRVTKAERQLHKEITVKLFQKLRNTQNFGNNFLRSIKLEEKLMLSKCGDLWMRVTATDELVLGLPLFNNCVPPNLTTIKNLQPIIIINDESTILTNENQNKLHFEHRLYQLTQTFENLESLETLFQTEDLNFQSGNTWQRETTNKLLPNGFAILLLKLKLSKLVLMNTTCQLFVRFEVEKDIEAIELKTQIFEQHLFVKALDFRQVLQQRLLYEISFHEQTLHQDLLALAITSNGTKLCLEFRAQTDLEKFEYLLAAKFEYDIVRRAIDSHTRSDEMTMDVDEKCEDLAKNLTGTLFYNRKPNSLWFGSLVLQRTATKSNYVEANGPLQSDWIFYHKNEEKSFLMFKLLIDEMIFQKCNINITKYSKYQREANCKLISFENAIREELETFSELYQIENDAQKSKDKYKLLAKNQFYTDLIANEL